MPPLQVMFDGVSYWLWDGFHRRWAADRAGLEKLPCIVTDGTQQDAQWASYGANATHGMRRTNADKAKAVKAALRHPTASKMSDDKIAEHVGVHRNTILKYREELTSTNCASREGRDGRTINTANIGRAASSIKEAATPKPEVEVTELPVNPEPDSTSTPNTPPAAPPPAGFDRRSFFVDLLEVIEEFLRTKECVTPKVREQWDGVAAIEQIVKLGRALSIHGIQLIEDFRAWDGYAETTPRTIREMLDE